MLLIKFSGFKCAAATSKAWPVAYFCRPSSQKRYLYFKRIVKAQQEYAKKKTKNLIWSTKPKIFTIWSTQKKSTDPCKQRFNSQENESLEYSFTYELNLRY